LPILFVRSIEMDIGDTFSAIFGNIRYQYFCQQAAPLWLLHNSTTSRGVSARAHAVRRWCTVQGDVGPKLHAMDTRAGVRLLRR